MNTLPNWLRLTYAAEDILDEEFDSEKEWELVDLAIHKANELARRDGYDCINGTIMRHAASWARIQEA